MSVILKFIKGKAFKYLKEAYKKAGEGFFYKGT